MIFKKKILCFKSVETFCTQNFINHFLTFIGKIISNCTNSTSVLGKQRGKIKNQNRKFTVQVVHFDPFNSSLNQLDLLSMFQTLRFFFYRLIPFFIKVERKLEKNFGKKTWPFSEDCKFG